MVKVRKEPKRTCMGCKQIEYKRALVRIVRATAGGVKVDSFGHVPGRGAYIHPSAECLNNAFKRNAVQRSLKVDFNDETVENIKRDFEKITHSR